MVAYDVVIRYDAEKTLNEIPFDDSNRIKNTLREVASNRKPTSHNKCECLQNNHDATVYKIRVGNYRVLCRLNKPELQVLKITTRQSAYRDIDDVYASL